MTESHRNRQMQRGERSSEMLRDQLELEFIAIHQRRQVARRIVRLSTFTTLVVVVAVGLLWSTSLLTVRSNPAAQLAQAAVHVRLPVAPTKGDPSRAPANYAAIKVIDLSDEELRSLLATTKAQWFVAEIDGKPTAFPLESSQHKSVPPSSLN